MKTAEEWRRESDDLGLDDEDFLRFLRAIQADALRWAADRCEAVGEIDSQLVFRAKADAIERGDSPASETPANQ